MSTDVTCLLDAVHWKWARRAWRGPGWPCSSSSSSSLCVSGDSRLGHGLELEMLRSRRLEKLDLKWTKIRVLCM